MKVETDIIIRFSDCDPMGHTNNATYFTYMEEGRVGFFKAFYGKDLSGPVSKEHFPFIIAEISCKFLQPTYVNQTLTVCVEVTAVKNSSFLFGYELKDKATGKLVATGSSAQVYYDYASGQSKPIPEEFKKRLMM